MPTSFSRSYMATVRALSNAVEARDAYTGKHAERVTAYGLEIARAVGLSVSDVAELEFGFLLHDIGKVAIPDSILYKPGRSTHEERALMSQHPVIGAEIVRDIEFLAEAAAGGALPPRALGRDRLPRSARRHEDPAGGADVRGRRRARRADHRSPVPPRLAAATTPAR